MREKIVNKKSSKSVKILLIR